MSLFSRALRITVNNHRYRSLNFFPLTLRIAFRILHSKPVNCAKSQWKNSSPRCLFSVNSYPLQAVKVTQAAPDFRGTAVVNQDFKEIKLSDFRGKYLVLFFYPLDFTFVCPTELIAFSERYDDFKKIQTEIVGCSTDSQYSHLAWINTPRKMGGVGELKYPLLADFTKTIARSYDVLIESSGVALRGLFIIDAEGIIRQMTINDLPVGRNAEEVLRLVKAFQFHDKHGEVCPANWQPDGDTIKPNPKDSKEYFQKSNPDKKS